MLNPSTLEKIYPPVENMLDYLQRHRLFTQKVPITTFVIL